MNELTFSKDNVLIRIAGTYPLYFEKNIDNICRLGRRILASILITMFLAFGVVGLGLIFSGVAHPANHLLLQIAAVCGGLLLMVLAGVILMGVGFFIFGSLYKVTETSFFKRMLRKLSDRFCTENINYSGLAFTVANTYGKLYETGIDNTCRMYRRFIGSLLTTALLTMAGVGVLLAPIAFFVSPDILPILLGISMCLGIIVWGLAALFGIIYLLATGAEKFDESNSGAAIETKRIFHEIKDSHKRHICKFINIRD